MPICGTAGYVAACCDAAITAKNGVLVFEPAAYAELRDRFAVHGHLPSPRRKTAEGPGTLLAMVIRIITFGLLRPCTICRGRARQLIGWGGVACSPAVSGRRDDVVESQCRGTGRRIMPGTLSAMNHTRHSL